jgi:hypothetical protein
LGFISSLQHLAGDLLLSISGALCYAASSLFAVCLDFYLGLIESLDTAQERTPPPLLHEKREMNPDWNKLHLPDHPNRFMYGRKQD